MIEPTDRLGRKLSYPVLPAFCAAILLWTAVAPFSRVFQWEQIGYSEGWNVYNAQKVAEHQPLYPAAYGWTAVNYPALSFHLVAALGRITEDYLFTGRILSLASLCLSGVLAGCIVFVATRSKAAAWLCGMYLVAIFCADAPGRVGLDDPQMLAQVFLLAGIYVYLRGNRQGWALELTALLFVLGGNIKHNLIEFPLAVLLDLLLSAPRRALRFAVGIAAMATIALVLTRQIDGAAFLSCLLAPRDYSVHNAIVESRNVLGPILLPTLAALWMARSCWKNPSQRVLTLLLFCALGMDTLLSGGRGVSINGMFGAVLAIVLLTGVFWAHLYQLPRARLGFLTPAWACALFFVWLAIPMIVWGNWQTEAALERNRESARRFAAEVAYLRQQPGPALCESLLRCYYASKPYLYDPFNASRFIEQGKLDTNVLVNRLKNREFGAIQLKGSVQQKLGDPGAYERFSPPILTAIEQYYYPGFENEYGTIYLPRRQNQQTMYQLTEAHR
jgi:hypothetical protein